MNDYYDNGLNLFTTGDIDWPNDSIYVSLIYGDEYTFDKVNHQFFSDVPSLAIASTLFMSGRQSIGKGVMDADDIKFPSVPGDGIKLTTALIIWKNLNNSSIISPLISWIDQATELPIAPDGNDIDFTWNNGNNRILTLRNYE